MAKAQRSQRPDEPNFVVPLATSVTQRGAAGYTHSITNSEDSRKLNCVYEVSKNPLTGKGTLVLSKRPGVSDQGQSYGSSTQTVYLAVQAPMLSNTSQGDYFTWIINVSGGQIRASSSSVSTNIVAFGTNAPGYIDKTNISGTDTVVFQTVPFATSSPHRVWYSSAIATWTEITDVDFTGLIHRGKMEHMDGYAFILESQNRIFNSDLNSLANWTATSFLTKQIVQDVPVGLAKLNNQILAFGQETVEMFYNAGNAVGSPLSPIRHLHQRIGLVAPIQTADEKGHYYAVSGNKLYFVGRNTVGKSSVGVFSYDGSAFSKVSTSYIDEIIGERVFSVTGGFSSVNSCGINGQQGIAFLLTNMNVSAPRWLMYFPVWNEWFEWTSSVFLPINNGENYLSCGTNLKNKIYKFSPSDNWQDAGTSYQWFTQFRLPNKGSARRFMPLYGVEADTSRGANNLTVEVSDDDCVSFSTLGTIDLTQDRKVLFRGGSFRNRHIRLGNTNDAETRIQNFIAQVN